MDEGNRPVKNEDPSDLSGLLPAVSISRKKVIIALGTIAVLMILTVAHYFTKSESAPDVLLRETPNGTVAIPETASEPNPNAAAPEIVKDKDSREYLTGEIIVVFRSTVPVEDAKRIIEEQGATVKQHFTNMPVFLVGISEPGADGVNRAILKFQTLAGVERAEPNYLTQVTESVAN